MPKHDHRLPSVGTRPFESGANQRAADALTLLRGIDSHRRESECSHHTIVDCNLEYAEQYVTDDLCILDRDQLDRRQSRVTERLDQPRFVGPPECGVRDARDIGIIGQYSRPDRQRALIAYHKRLMP
jgi:hypothetical protein